MDRFDHGVLVGVDDVQLGVITPVDHAFDSICDNTMDGGAAFGPHSIFNDQSQYGGPFGANSPFNPDATDPPRILVDGELVGVLTVSVFVDDAVDPYALLSSLGCPASSV